MLQEETSTPFESFLAAHVPMHKDVFLADSSCRKFYSGSLFFLYCLCTLYSRSDISRYTSEKYKYKPC